MRVSSKKTLRVSVLGSKHLCRLLFKKLEKLDNIKKLNRVIFPIKNIGIYKTARPHSYNRVSDIGFHDDSLF